MGIHAARREAEGAQGGRRRSGDESTGMTVRRPGPAAFGLPLGNLQQLIVVENAQLLGTSINHAFSF